MKRRKFLAVMCGFVICVSLTACDNSTAASASTAVTAVIKEETTASKAQETVDEAKVQANWETIAPEDVDVSSYKISSGTWFYHGIEDEKSIDMDGLKGFTSYTVEAIPETDGYLQYLGINPDGYHEFEVYDIFGKYFTSMIFISEEQFYLSGDENEYYVKWDY